MRALLCLSLLFCSVSALNCPPQFIETEGRCIKPLLLQAIFMFGRDIADVRNECTKDGAHLPIIKSDEDNAMFVRIANSIDEIATPYITLVLDLVCNTTRRHLDWIDGTPMDYIPAGSTDEYGNPLGNFDCVTRGEVFVLNVFNRNWISRSTTVSYEQTVLCVFDSTPMSTQIPSKTTTTTVVPKTTTLTTSTRTTGSTTMPRTTPIPQDSQCGDYSLILNPADATKPCMKVFTEPTSWENAERQCAADFGSLVTINSAEENKFFWRTAVEKNIVDGMHIGAHQLTEHSKSWVWVDGEVPIDGHYDNFIGSFPFPGLGDCAAMMTDSTYAFWINEDCNEDKLPFICRRTDFSTVPASCPMDPPKAEEDIFPPGFPNSDISCSYVLVVAEKRLVQLEVITLVAETNKDFLEIHEGPVGSNLLANLTGTILTPTTIKTANSNLMRVNWKPNGAGTGRGFRIRYTEVDS